MLIAIAVDERSPQAAVSEHLEEAKFLFIVETEQQQVVKVLEAGPERPDLQWAQATLSQGCEAIICGDIGREAYDLLADNMLTRYYGWGANASQAVRLMADNRLQLIRESRDGGRCQGEDHWAELQRCIDAVNKD